MALNSPKLISMPAPGTSIMGDERRRTIMAAAVLAQKGFYGTTTHEIAAWVGISQPYLYRLYPNKEALFAAAVDHVSGIMTETLVAHALAPSEIELAPEAAFEATRRAYATLVTNRNILRFLMHANCAACEPLVGQALRRCYAKQVCTVRQMLGDDDAVRSWFGAGMLDNVIAVLGLDDIDDPWARVFTARCPGTATLQHRNEVLHQLPAPAASWCAKSTANRVSKQSGSG